MRRLVIISSLLTASLFGDARPQYNTEKEYSMYVQTSDGEWFYIGTQPYRLWMTELHSLETNGVPSGKIIGFILIEVLS